MTTKARTRSGPDELGESIGRSARELAGLVRRMIVTRTRSALWQITGHRIFDATPTTEDAEVFGGIGFTSRPAEGGDAGDVEAVVVFPQGAGPIVIGARQEASRRLVALDLAADETQMHGAIAAGGTIFRIFADGTAEIRTVGGIARRLAFADELEALADDFYGHGHPSTGAGPIPTFTPPDPPGSPLVNPGQTGTVVLKAE